MHAGDRRVPLRHLRRGTTSTATGTCGVAARRAVFGDCPLPTRLGATGSPSRGHRASPGSSTDAGAPVTQGRSAHRATRLRSTSRRARSHRPNGSIASASPSSAPAQWVADEPISAHWPTPTCRSGCAKTWRCCDVHPEQKRLLEGQARSRQRQEPQGAERPQPSPTSRVVRHRRGQRDLRLRQLGRRDGGDEARSTTPCRSRRPRKHPKGGRRRRLLGRACASRCGAQDGTRKSRTRGLGAPPGLRPTVGEAIEDCIKAAETDATKRALRHLRQGRSGWRCTTRTGATSGRPRWLATVARSSRATNGPWRRSTRASTSRSLSDRRPASAPWRSRRGRRRLEPMDATIGVAVLRGCACGVLHCARWRRAPAVLGHCAAPERQPPAAGRAAPLSR